MEEQPQLQRMTFEFAQEANCIECESSLGIDADSGCFYVLKTEAWSIESVDELQKLFDRIKKVIEK